MKIIKTIRKSQILEKVFIVLLVAAYFCKTIGHYDSEIDQSNEESVLVWNVFGLIFELCFEAILVYTLLGVSK